MLTYKQLNFRKWKAQPAACRCALPSLSWSWYPGSWPLSGSLQFPKTPDDSPNHDNPCVCSMSETITTPKLSALECKLPLKQEAPDTKFSLLKSLVQEHKWSLHLKQDAAVTSTQDSNLGVHTGTSMAAMFLPACHQRKGMGERVKDKGPTSHLYQGHHCQTQGNCGQSPHPLHTLMRNKVHIKLYKVRFHQDQNHWYPIPAPEALRASEIKSSLHFFRKKNSRILVLRDSNRSHGKWNVKFSKGNQT